MTEPGSCENKAFAASDGVAIEQHLFSEALSAEAEEMENSLCAELAGDENQGPEMTQPPHDRGLRESSPSTALSTHSAKGNARRTGSAVS